MATNFIKQISELFGKEFISKSASELGEMESDVQKSLGAIIPSIFGALINKSNSSHAGISDLLGKINGEGLDKTNIKGPFFDGNENASTFSNTDTILTSLFGDKIGELTTGLSNFSGMRSTSIVTLLASIVPIILSFFKKFTIDNNLTSEAQIQDFLNTQTDYVAAATPAAFDIGNMLKFSTSTQASQEARPGSAYYEEKPKKGGAGWLLWLILLAAAALLIWYLIKGCNANEVEKTTNTVVDDSQKAMDTIKKKTTVAGTEMTGTLDSFDNWIADWGTEKSIQLPDGTILKVGEFSTEYKLYHFITHPGFNIDTMDKSANWISFDRVYFETGKSVLTTTSQAQVKNIALILKNYPDAAIKIGGYTDNTGNADINKKVSDERAKIVAKELVKWGATQKQVVESIGYGSEHPVCQANDTKECQAQNRRVDLKLASK